MKTHKCGRGLSGNKLTTGRPSFSCSLESDFLRMSLDRAKITCDNLGFAIQNPLKFVRFARENPFEVADGLKAKFLGAQKCGKL